MLKYLECPSNIEDIPPELQIIFKREGIGDNHVHWGAAFFYEHLLERHRTASETRSFFEQWLNKGDIENTYCDSWVKLYNSYYFNPVPTFLFHGLLAGLIDRFIKGAEPECLGNIGKARRLYEDIFSQSFIRPGNSIPSFDGWFAGMHRVLNYWDDIDDKRWMYARRNRSRENFEIPKLLSNASFLAKLFSFLELSSPSEERTDAYNYLFDRMLSIRCLLYSHITQSPGNPGLPEFRKWFNRMRRVRQLINPPISLRERAEALSRDGSLSHLEFRIDCDIKVYDLLREYGHWRKWPEVEHDFQRQFGSHVNTSASSLSLPVLPRKKEEKQDNNNPRHGIKKIAFSLGLSKDPQEKSAHIVRFASLLNRYRKSIDEFFKIVKPHKDIPPRSAIFQLVRGLDVYNDELSIPNWVPALIYQYFDLRCEIDSLVPVNARIKHTFHAGEDFNSPLEGLRYVHEAMFGAKLKQGCRIGHSMALVKEIKIKAFQVKIGNWLENLIWEWGIWEQLKKTEELKDVERELNQVKYIIGKKLSNINKSNYETAKALTGADPRHLWNAFQYRFDFNELEKYELVYRTPRRDWFEFKACQNLKDGEPGHEILYIYLCHEIIREIEDESWEIKITDQQASRWKALQEHIRWVLGQHGLTIEVCPTSNFLIGGFRDFREHPIFDFAPIAGGSFTPVCLNTDDPILFNMTLHHEYVNLFYAALERGENRKALKEWLRKVSTNGRDSTFCCEQINDQALRELYKELSPLNSVSFYQVGR
jgi:hypothetical protein